MANVVNVDGDVVSEADARIPVLDRGFLFGDSIYEVVRTHGDVPFGWPEHWQRLQRSAEGLRLRLDLDEAGLARRIAATLRAADHGDSYVRVVVSRGSGKAPNIDLAYAPGPPRWIVMVRPLVPPSADVRLCFVDRLRVDRRALDPATKSGNYLNSVLALAEAKDRGATDCLMCNGDGFVTEASTSNVWARLDGVWCTPPLSAGILAGVTRALLLEWLPSVGERAEERDLRPEDLRRADELFLSSTLRDIAPVSHLDGRPVAANTVAADTVAENTAGGTARAPELLARFRAHVAQRLREHDAPAWRRLVGGP